MLRVKIHPCAPLVSAVLLAEEELVRHLHRLISNEGTKTLTGFFATFYARGIFGNSALPKLALVLSANFGGLLRPVHPHLFRHQMITYLTSWDLSDAQIPPDLRP
jgi:hypothetical protein